jgi:hypothetical protein
MPATAQVTHAEPTDLRYRPRGSRDADQLLQELEDRIEDVADRAEHAVEEPVARAVQLDPVADVVEPAVEAGGVLEAELAGLLAAQDHPEDQPDDDDAQHLDPGPAVLAVLDVRLLLLGGGRLGCGRGGHVS